MEAKEGRREIITSLDLLRGVSPFLPMRLECCLSPVEGGG